MSGLPEDQHTVIRTYLYILYENTRLHKNVYVDVWFEFGGKDNLSATFF